MNLAMQEQQPQDDASQGDVLNKAEEKSSLSRNANMLDKVNSLREKAK